MAIEGPDKEVLGGEEQQSIAPEFDAKVLRIIRDAVGIPDDLRTAFEEEYNDKDLAGGIRDKIAEDIGQALKISRMLGDIDPESSAIHACLKEETKIRENLRLFAAYLELMDELGHEPVDATRFAYCKQSGYIARNQKKRGLDQSIRLRFKEIDRHKMRVNTSVAARSDGSKHPRVYSIVDITPDCHLMLVGVEYPIDPRNYRIQS